MPAIADFEIISNFYAIQVNEWLHLSNILNGLY